jgi:TolB-like protein/Tfp pilus assembly protein PilF
MGELGSPDILEFGHFRFDRRGRCLYRLDKAGNPVLLPAGRTALDILGLLVEHAGEVVESEEIRRIVWRGKTVEDANLATQIFHLRESVGRDRIQTVSGRGYRFVRPVKRLRADRGAAPAFSGEKDEPPQPAASEQINDFVDRPAVAVLPFANLRGDPDQQHFADGITDEIITELASWRSFPVIARGSSFSFRNQAVDVENLSKQLGARYLLKGSVAKTGGRVRITAQLIDAANGQYLVVERYERNLSELFDVHDEIVEAIVGSIAPEVLKVERERVNRRQPPNPTSYEYFVRGLEFHYRYNKDDNAEAQRLFHKSIAADPKNAQAHAVLAHAMLYAVQHRWREDEEHNFRIADDLAARAIALDSRAPFAHFAFGSSAMFLGRTEQALAEMKEAVRLNPSHAAAHAIMAHLLCYTGRPTEALQSIEKALRLSPHDPRLGIWIPALAQAHYFMEQYDSAIAAAQRALALITGNVIATRFLAASLGQLNRAAEAEPWVNFLRDSREPTLADQQRLMEIFYRGPNLILHVLDGLKKAGMT